MKAIKPFFFGVVKNRRLELYHEKVWLAHVSTFEGQEVRISIERRPAAKKPRTDSQNRYYWGVVIPLIGDEIGLNADETHELLRWEFLKERRIIEKDKAKYCVEIARSTTTLSTIDMGVYIDSIKNWAITAIGVHIPEPDEVHHEYS